MPAPRPFAPAPPPARPATPQPAATVQPAGGRPVTVLPPKQQVGPGLFTSSGFFHPLVALGPALVLAPTVGGPLAAVVAVVALILLPFAWKRIRPLTWLLAMGVTILTLFAISSSQDDPYHALRDLSDVPSGVTAPPAADPYDPGPAAAIAPDLMTDPEQVHDVAGFMLPDLLSEPVTASDESLPEPLSPLQSARPAVDLRQLDVAPRLEMAEQAMHYAALAYAQAGGGPVRPDTALLWMRIEPNGIVGERRVLRATSERAAQAAYRTAQYLGYTAGSKAGSVYPVWVVQRFVFVLPDP